MDCVWIRPTLVRLQFCKFFKVTPRKVPYIQEFERIINIIQKTGDVTPQNPLGRSETPGDKISAVKSVLDYLFRSRCTERVTKVGP